MKRMAVIGFSLCLVACIDTTSEQPRVDPTQSGSVVTDHIAGTGAINIQEALSSMDASPVTESGAWHFLETGVMEFGEPEEPYTLTVFLEYHCPYCKEFIEVYLPKLSADIPGLKIRMVPFPLKKYPDSRDAVAAMLCAGAQGRGGGMHKLLFANPDKRRSQILNHADTLGINKVSLEQCLDSAGIQAFLNAHRKLAEDLDVTLVPTFFIGEERQVGLPVYPELRGWVEANL